MPFSLAGCYHCLMNHLSFLALLLLSGCAAAPTDDPVHAASITLLPEQSAPLSRSTTLRYDQVADSRCPTDVQCIWAGMVSYTLTLSTARGKQSFTLHQDAPAATIKGLRIAIGTALPPPHRATSDPAAPHPVTFTIHPETP